MSVRAVLVALALLQVAPAAAQAEVIKTKYVLNVYAKPRKGSHDRGQVMAGGRFEVLEKAQGKGCRDAWLRIGERAWICSTGTDPTTEPAGGPTGPEVAAGKTLPTTYVVTRDAPVYPSLEAAAVGRGARKLPGLGGYRYAGADDIGGKRFLRVGGGWVPDTHAKVVESISFRGVELPADAASKRLAFVGPLAAMPVDAAGKPIAGAATIPAQSYLGEVGAPVKVGKLTLYPIGGDRYLRAGELCLVRFGKLPAGVTPGERWIDVDLDQQIMVGWEGTVPRYATLVSTAHTATPIGTFRIEKKRPSARMQSRPHYRTKWDIDAPWVISIAGRIAIHTAYWHTDYGTERSQGCVNLSPIDARWLWEFTSPALPPGWLRIETDSKDRPTLVRIRRSHG